METPESPDTGILRPETLAEFPAALLAELQEAVEALDVDASQRVIEQIRRQNAPFAEALAGLVNQYQFGRLQRLCEKAESSSRLTGVFRG